MLGLAFLLSFFPNFPRRSSDDARLSAPAYVGADENLCENFIAFGDFGGFGGSDIGMRPLG